MIVILDTDLLTILQRQADPEFSRLRLKLQSLPPEKICTTIINFEEQIRGWLLFISDSKLKHQEIFAYKRLHSLIGFFNEFTLLNYDAAAAEQFTKLRQLRLKIGTMDLKIAAIAISINALLLSRNLKDFHKISGLRVEDWAA
jgi:tRNA(fMet)-specific endonuclease VapC